MQNLFNNLTQKFRKHKGLLTRKEFDNISMKYALEDVDTLFFILEASGYPIEETKRGYRLKSYFKDYKEQKYCIVDIETNGSNPKNSQVIELGAVMVENGKIIDNFETFVECTFLPEYITKITGIETQDLKNAPPLKEILTNFKYFLKDAVFVAHNASFDFSYLNASFCRVGLGEIGNQKLCTIDLAKRTFESERYGLAYLIDFLEIKTATHHRAYSDAVCAYEVMKKSLNTIPKNVKTTDELLKFSISNRKERKFLHNLDK